MTDVKDTQCRAMFIPAYLALGQVDGCDQSLRHETEDGGRRNHRERVPMCGPLCLTSFPFLRHNHDVDRDWQTVGAPDVCDAEGESEGPFFYHKRGQEFGLGRIRIKKRNFTPSHL